MPDQARQHLKRITRISEPSFTRNWNPFVGGKNVRYITMNFRDSERSRLIGLRDGIFRDPGSGLFFRKPREFVLSDPTLNLWEGIRQDAIEYFKSNEIQWWAGKNDEPTGHLLSSQIACVNHLYLLRQRPDLATAVLRAIDPAVTNAVIVDDG